MKMKPDAPQSDVNLMFQIFIMKELLALKCYYLREDQILNKARVSVCWTRQLDLFPCCVSKEESCRFV